jgi:hypothetical protein
MTQSTVEKYNVLKPGTLTHPRGFRFLLAVGRDIQMGFCCMGSAEPSRIKRIPDRGDLRQSEADCPSVAVLQHNALQHSALWVRTGGLSLLGSVENFWLYPENHMILLESFKSICWLSVLQLWKEGRRTGPGRSQR